MKFSLSQRVLQDLELNKKEKPQSKHMLYKILTQTPHSGANLYNNYNHRSMSRLAPIKPRHDLKTEHNTVYEDDGEDLFTKQIQGKDRNIIKLEKLGYSTQSNEKKIQRRDTYFKSVSPNNMSHSNLNVTAAETSSRLLSHKKRSTLSVLLDTNEKKQHSPNIVSQKTSQSMLGLNFHQPLVNRPEKSQLGTNLSSQHGQRSDHESLIHKSTSYKILQIGVKNQDKDKGLSYKQEFHKNIFFPLINNKHLQELSQKQLNISENQLCDSSIDQILTNNAQIDQTNSKISTNENELSLFQNHPIYQDFEHKMHDYLLMNKLDQAIQQIEQELKDDPSHQILEAFQNSTLFQDLVRKNNGLVEDNGRIYNLLDRKDLIEYINREIESKEKTYDQQDQQTLAYNRRQIKYLFSSLIERNYEQQMKPDYEKQFQNDLFKNTAQNEYEWSQNLLKQQRKLDLFDTDQVKQYYQQSKKHKITLAQEDELKQKIIDFARGLEMDKSKDYEQIRQKFHLTYNFDHKDKIQEDDQTATRKSIKRFLSTQSMHLEQIDHSQEMGRGTEYNLSQKVRKDNEAIQKEMTTFNRVKNVDEYYLNNDNYKDDVPFDLYNMVSLAKRIDFKHKLDLEMKDITKDIIKSQFDDKIKIKDIQDLARKHLPKEIIEEDGHFYIHSVADNSVKHQKHQDKQKQKGMPKSMSLGNLQNSQSVNKSQIDPNDQEISQYLKTNTKYNKWFINANHRFMKEINLNKQPGIKVFDASKYQNLLELKKSGFIPYFKFGKYNQYEMKQDPDLQEAMRKYQVLQRQLKVNEVAKVYKEYLSEKKGGDQYLPNYLRKVKGQSPKKIYTRRSSNDDGFSKNI